MSVKFKNAWLYIVLWSAGCLVSAVIVVMWNSAGDAEEVLVFDRSVMGSENINATNNIVNELLLSANELSIYGKSSLIDYNNRYESESDELIEQIKINPEKAYSAILKKKLIKISQKPVSSDFEIKPIPKQ